MARRTADAPGDRERARIEANRACAEQAFAELRGSTWRRSLASDPLAALLRPLVAELALVTRPGSKFARVSGYGAIDGRERTIYLNPAAPGAISVDACKYVIAHLALHLGFEHQRIVATDAALLVACEAQVDNLLERLGLARPPSGYQRPALPDEDPVRLAEALRDGAHGPLPALVGMAGSGRDTVAALDGPDYAARLAEGFESLLAVRIGQLGGAERAGDLAEQARRHIVNRYPLLAGMASRIRIVSSPDVLRREGIESAAVNPALGEIYLRLESGVTLREAIYLLAHELLHLGLRHGERAAGRDPLVWNYACDFVIANWLAAMGIGAMPQAGALYDPATAGMSAEAIYDLLIADPARRRRLRTFAGLERGDIVLAGPRTVLRGDVQSLDDIWFSALRSGLDACRAQLRGTLPADLEEEIEALDMAPIAWDVALAHWFDEHVTAVEPRRSYARASRRQSASPDIPRPRWVVPDELVRQATFGVLLDSSGSMDRLTLARALGTIAAYAEMRGVRWVRLVACDARPYDEGYVDTERLRGAYTIKGRGGTTLQPAVDLLLAAADFPPDAPLLILTDGGFEPAGLSVARRHAYVVPDGSRLPPLAPDADVFGVL